MKLILIIGDASVGKMTVGQELMKITDLRLFHNHMTIEPILEIFGYFDKTTIGKWRKAVFEEFAKSENYGLIFTYCWAFNSDSDWQYVEKTCRIFEEQGSDIYFVELNASLEVRLVRNKTQNRLIHKASKRDLDASENRMIKDYNANRFISREGEIKHPNYLRIDNTDLSAVEVAKRIKEKFNL
jgi:hypothetical protein